jgi:hypothetical protein
MTPQSFSGVRTSIGYRRLQPGSARGHEHDPAEHLSGVHLLVSQPSLLQRQRFAALAIGAFQVGIGEAGP